VLILNNTVTQPDDHGIEQIFDGQPVEMNLASVIDSMAWLAIDEISIIFDESNFFNEVAFYREPVRTDSEWLSVKTLSPEDQSDFYYLNDYDALFVIDRLLFSVKEDVKKIQTGAFSIQPTFYVDMRVEATISCSMYIYGEETPVTTFSITDSLFVKSTILNSDSTFFLKEIPEYVMRRLSWQLGNQAATRFIPTWRTEERTLFTGYGSRMKEATGYVNNKRWANAEALWMAELERKTQPADKAKLAYNLAVANEMQDKFEQALTWAKQARDYLTAANQQNNSPEAAIVNNYFSELERRMQNNRLLDLQWGTTNQ
jgi:hypothetical protein